MLSSNYTRSELQLFQYRFNYPFAFTIACFFLLYCNMQESKHNPDISKFN